MKATISIDPAELVISCSEVIRFTGGTVCRAGDDLRSLAFRMIARAAELIVPTYAYKICDIEQTTRILEQAGQPAAASCPQPSSGVRCPTAALAICTLGPQLDLEAAKLNHAAAHLESLLLHSAGSPRCRTWPTEPPLRFPSCWPGSSSIHAADSSRAAMVSSSSCSLRFSAKSNPCPAEYRSMSIV